MTFLALLIGAAALLTLSIAATGPTGSRLGAWRATATLILVLAVIHALQGQWGWMAGSFIAGAFLLWWADSESVKHR